MPDLVAYEFPEWRVGLLCDSVGECDGGESSGLCDDDLSEQLVVLFDEELPDLGAFP